MKTETGDSVDRIIAWQAFFVTATPVVSFFIGGISAAGAALYGGAVALVNSWLLRRSVWQAISTNASQRGNLNLLMGLAERLAAAIVLFAIGFAWLKLNPLPVIAGFAVAQFAYGWGAIKKR
ncbi:MAG: ATP synthase subunit I [Chromatiales bacterium]